MTAHGPALIAKAAQVIHDAYCTAPTPMCAKLIAGIDTERARAVLNAVADDLRAGALEEAADVLDRGEGPDIEAYADDRYAEWLLRQAAEIRAGAS